MKKLILIDLDGVLNTYKGDYKKDFIHPPKPETKEILYYINKISQKFKNSDNDKLKALAMRFTLDKTISFCAVSILPKVERPIFARKDSSSCVKLFSFLNCFILLASFFNNILSIFKLSAIMTK